MSYALLLWTLELLEICTSSGWEVSLVACRDRGGDINMRTGFWSHVFQSDVRREGAVLLALRYSDNGSEKSTWVLVWIVRIMRGAHCRSVAKFFKLSLCFKHVCCFFSKVETDSLCLSVKYSLGQLTDYLLNWIGAVHVRRQPSLISSWLSLELFQLQCLCRSLGVKLSFSVDRHWRRKYNDA